MKRQYVVKCVIEFHAEAETPEESIEVAKAGIKQRVLEMGIDYLIKYCMEFTIVRDYISAVDQPPDIRFAARETSV